MPVFLVMFEHTFLTCFIINISWTSSWHVIIYGLLNWTNLLVLESAKSKRLFYTKIPCQGLWSSPFSKFVRSAGNNFSFWSILLNSEFATFLPIRGSSVLGKPMEPRNMTTCSVYFWAGVNNSGVLTSQVVNNFYSFFHT